MLEIERNATVKLVDSGFVPEAEKKKWKYYDDEEKCFAVYPLVQFVHDSMLGGRAYEALRDEVIPVHVEPKKSSRKTALALGIVGALAAAALGHHLYTEEQKRPYRQAGLNDEQVNSFLANYPQQNGNSSWVSFAKSWANNRALADESLKTFGNLKDSLEYLYFANSNGFDGLNYLKDFPQFAKNYKEVLPAYSANSSLAKIVYDQFQRDPRISLDRNDLFLKGLKEYQDLNLVDKNLMIQTVHAVNNLTLAYEQGLPELDKNSAWLLTNATQKDGNIVDFSPIKFSSVDSSNVYITPIPSRETYITAKQLQSIKESGFDIENHPEMFLGLNRKIIINAWCIFDNPVGINSVEKNLTVTDRRVLDLMMLQWRLYSQFAPQMNGSYLLYNRNFPWYNSTELRAIYTDGNVIDENGMNAALFYLFYLPSSTFSIKDQKKVLGIEGARISLLDAYDEYQKIVSLYPDGKVQTKYLGLRNPRFFYYDWLDDRYHNGLSNTVSQFVGDWDDSKVQHGENITYDWIENQNGLNQFLTKNWKYWDLVKFIVGYERWNPIDVGEIEKINCIMPEVLKMFGFSVSHINIEPTPLGAANREWAVGLPPYIVKSINENFPNTCILFGPGYTFGLYSMGDGLLKERGIDSYHNPITNGIKEVYTMFGDKSIYLMKRD
jgi:hypothetical protein